VASKEARLMTALTAKSSGGGWHTYAIPGIFAVGSGTLRIPITKAQTIKSVRVMAAVAPTGTDAIFDVNRNGTSIYTTQANRPTIPATANDSGAGIAPDITTLAAGDYLTIDLDQIGNILPGTDGTIVIEVS